MGTVPANIDNLQVALCAGIVDFKKPRQRFHHSIDPNAKIDAIR